MITKFKIFETFGGYIPPENKSKSKPSKTLLILLDAVDTDDIKTVETLLNKNNVNFRFNNGGTLLLSAIQSYIASIDMIKLLMKNGANPNIKTINGNSPLQLICMQHRDREPSLEILKELLKYKKLDKEILSKSLWWSTFYYFNDGILELLKYGANINIVIDDKTPLMLAVSKSRLSTIKILLDNEADCYIKNSYDEDFIDVASRKSVKYIEKKFPMIMNIKKYKL